ncbi:MAG: hypothetical protein QS721_08160 [Candidatus Endonucleobacter sp. (ex Gigantidas childressi)]|nr:hypothetical protein [Candidatus Endonucleobacter sp. (ex Gigantidas childressi)]
MAPKTSTIWWYQLLARNLNSYCLGCLDKKVGNSNTDERIAVMERVLNLIPIKRIDNLLADREFIGHEWLD